MPRGQPSEADRQLIDEVAGYDLTVSPYQLERWRLLGLLPKAQRQALGRGKGSSSAYGTDAVPRALLLALEMGQRRASAVGIVELFLHRFPMKWETLREAFGWSIGELERRNRRTRERGDLAVDKAVHRRTNQVLSREVIPATEGISEAPSRRLRQARRRELKEAVAVQVLVNIDGDLNADIMTEWTRAENGFGLYADQLGSVLIRAELEGFDSGSFSMQSLLETTTFERVKAARQVARMCSNLFSLMDSAARMNEPSAITLVSRLRDDLRAQELRHVLGYGPDWWYIHSIGPILVALSLNEPRLKMGWEFCRDEWTTTYRAYASAAERLGLLTPQLWKLLNERINDDTSQWSDHIVVEPDATEEEIRQRAAFLLSEIQAGRPLRVSRRTWKRSQLHETLEKSEP